MIRILRAFAWMRWRMLINSLEKTGSRDAMERFSLAIEKLGPIMAGVLMIPSALGLAALGAAGGYALASGASVSLLFEAGRYVLLPVTILCVAGPLMLPAADRTNPVRLLLLPIPRGTMYLAQSASALADPWILLMVALTLGTPLGLLAGGAIAAAVIALAGALLLLVALIGLSSLATSALHLMVRDRRRGELMALLFILIVPMIGMLPSLFEGPRRHRGARGAEAPGTELAAPGLIAAAGERAFGLLPTELYVAATRNAAQGTAAASGIRLAGLAVSALVLNALAGFVFGRVLDSPGASGGRRSVPMRAVWNTRIPGLSGGASAVALAHLRLALRTPRGRSIMLSPIVMLAICYIITRQKAGGAEISLLPFQSGLGIASFASFFCLMSILPIAMNQFAVDKAGLTMSLLAPLADRDYLSGKAVGNALIAAPPVAICLLLSALVFGGGSVALWSALPLALVAIFLVVAPLAAIASALFPRVVNLNSIGRGGNAHGLAGLIGLLSFVGAAAPPVLIGFATDRWLERPSLVPVFIAGWCVIAFGINQLLFIPARRVFTARRENLALLRTTGSPS